MAHPASFNLKDLVIEKYENEEITPGIVAESAKLFSENYGVWGPLAKEKIGGAVKEGKRIKSTPQNLRKQILPPLPSPLTQKHILFRAILPSSTTNTATSPILLGNLFATTYLPNNNHPQEKAAWITQLCILSSHHNLGIAKLLCSHLRAYLQPPIARPRSTEEEKETTSRIGVLSSSPHTILAILRVFAQGIENPEAALQSTKIHAETLMEACPVPYVNSARIIGSLFSSSCEEQDGQENERERAISTAHTNFYISHEVVDDAIRRIRGERGVEWPFGELGEGSEFLVVCEF